MNFKNVQLVNSIMAAYFGFGSLLMPDTFWGLYGLEVDGEGLWIARTIGILVISNLFIVFRSRSLEEQAGKRLIADFVTVVWGLYFIVALMEQLTGAANALNWTNVAGAVFFAVITFLVRDK